MRLALSDYAFPDGDGSAGMTMRDYFAAQALTIMSDIAIADPAVRRSKAHWAYALADDMLAERVKASSTAR